MGTKHFDEARNDALDAMRRLLEEEPSIERAVLIDDLFGRIRAVIWGPKESAKAHEELVSHRLRDAAGSFWAGELWLGARASDADQLVYDRAWDEGHVVNDRLRLADRMRNRMAWFAPLREPPWNVAGDGAGPPIVVFYSFKGGVGRTTSLASFAIQRARLGERVAVLDFDLDAPGVGSLLAADDRGTISRWGLVDYLLERPLGDMQLRDYYHACRRPEVTGAGEIVVFPAGRLDAEGDYLGKLARLDFEPPPAGAVDPFVRLLEQVRAELDVRWICIDARAGLSEPAGLLLSGIAHLHVVFGTSSDQSWRGLAAILERIGGSRVREARPQLDCLLVHAMVPQEAGAAKLCTERFAERARDEFREHYYAPESETDDKDKDVLWYVADAEGSDAPSAPVVVSYQAKLAYYDTLTDVADHLAAAPEFTLLAERIVGRFRPEEA
jgi:hypothetical protein